MSVVQPKKKKKSEERQVLYLFIQNLNSFNFEDLSMNLKH